MVGLVGGDWDRITARKRNPDLEEQKWKKKEVGVKPGDKKDWWWVEIHIHTTTTTTDFLKSKSGRRKEGAPKKKDAMGEKGELQTVHLIFLS